MRRTVHPLGPEDGRIDKGLDMDWVMDLSDGGSVGCGQGDRMEMDGADMVAKLMSNDESLRIGVRLNPETDESLRVGASLNSETDESLRGGVSLNSERCHPQSCQQGSIKEW